MEINDANNLEGSIIEKLVHYEDTIYNRSLKDEEEQNGDLIVCYNKKLLLEGDGSFSDEDSVIEDLTGEFSLQDFEFSEKVHEIEAVLNKSEIDKNELNKIARSSGGFVTDDLRKKAWPLLMEVELTEAPELSIGGAQECKDYNQVVMDVNRSLKRFPPGINEQNRYILMDQLTLLIIKILQKHPELNYYQGFHDVAITFLLVMGEDAAFPIVEKLSVEHLKDFMKPTMDTTLHYLTYLYPILKRTNPEIHDVLMKCEVGTIFCLPWLITWYAHTLHDYRDVVRLYDFFLASPFLMPIYFAIAIISYKEKEILMQEQDMAIIHSVLSKIPSPFPIEKLLEDATFLYQKYPPTSQIEKEVLEIIEKNEEEERKRLEERKLIEKKLLKARMAAAAKKNQWIPYLYSKYKNLYIPSKWHTYVGVALLSIALEEGIRQYYYSDSILFRWNLFSSI